MKTQIVEINPRAAALAIDLINYRSPELTNDTLALLARTVAQAAAHGDLPCRYWLWLFNWQPKQLVN